MSVRRILYRCKYCDDLDLAEGSPENQECWPSYSTDLNAAFAAAEKAGLFRNYAYCLASGQHVLSESVPVKTWADVIAHEETPCLAICAAILKLKE
jgi:hypothetical protein